MRKPSAYERIKVCVYTDPELYDSPSDIKQFHPEMIQELLNKQIWLVDNLDNQICREFGQTGWVIKFIKVNQYHNRFLVDIYLDDSSLFVRMCRLIHPYENGQDFKYYCRNFSDLN